MATLDKIKQPVQPVSTAENSSDPDTERVTREANAEEQRRKKQAELDAELDEKRKRRDFSEEKWFYWVRVGALGTTSILSLSVIGVYWWHLLAPEAWRWLSSGNLDRIERMATTIIVGIVGTLSASFFLKKH